MDHKDTASAPARLRLRVTAAAESKLRAGHPWLFSDSIREQNRPGTLGELGVVYDRKDRFLAIGLFDPESPIRMRILHAGPPVQLDPAWWRARLLSAKQRREGLFDSQTNGFRWISGESDGLPGLVIDRYGSTLVLKLYSGSWLPWLANLIPQVTEIFTPERIVLRLSRNIQDLAATCGLAEGKILYGPDLGGAVLFLETGIHFEAEVLRGQKTGFFLDQRENRRWVESIAQGKRVLNAFSFSGGFSLYAARGGAASVTDLDISAHALASAARNVHLNQTDPRIAGCPREAVQADVFEWLSQAGPSGFDLVILDPPSLAKRETERTGAIQAYRRLARLGWHQLAPGGVLVSASCSAHVETEEFYQAVWQGVQEAGSGTAEILHRTGHPPDHPIGFAEADYLKCISLRRPLRKVS